MQQESFKLSFKTPLATLHMEWFGQTNFGNSSQGLEDTNLKLLAKYAGYNFVLAGHSFLKRILIVLL